MTQEEKQLLLKDLCARLLYGVKVERNGDVCEVLGIIGDNITLTANVPTNQQTKVVNIKPYLRPMSSMTEEERKEFENLLEGIVDGIERWDKPDLCEEYDWLNAHHFDYRGLVEKGLAIEVTEDNNPYKE